MTDKVNIVTAVWETQGRSFKIFATEALCLRVGTSVPVCQENLTEARFCKRRGACLRYFKTIEQKLNVAVLNIVAITHFVAAAR